MAECESHQPSQNYFAQKKTFLKLTIGKHRLEQHRQVTKAPAALTPILPVARLLASNSIIKGIADMINPNICFWNHACLHE